MPVAGRAAIVGAGIMGLATARALARRGWDVTIYEQFEVGHNRGSSHGRSRIFRLAYPDPEWVRLAKEAGAHDAIDYRKQDFEAEVKRITGGAGVHVVYDSVGKDTWEKSLRCLRPRGMLVLFGQSSGPVPPFDPQLLAQGGSLFFTRPTLGHYVLTRDELLHRAGAVLGAVERGDLKVKIEQVLPLGEAGKAHELLCSRKTAGKLLLVP